MTNHELWVKHGAKPSECLIRDAAGRAFEVALGAILTQNTAWTNVETALVCLAKKKLLTPQAVLAANGKRLAACIRSSGYFRQKAKKLKIFSRFVLKELDGDLRNLCRGRPGARPPSDRPVQGDRKGRPYAADARDLLLSLWGIGPETADTILLYALNHPSFVVDAYTRRWLVHLAGRAHAARPCLTCPYDEIKALFESILPRSIKVYQETHALLVRWGKGTIGSHGRPARGPE